MARGISPLFPELACKEARPHHIYLANDKTVPDCSRISLRQDALAQRISPLFPELACKEAQPQHIYLMNDKAAPDCSEI